VTKKRSKQQRIKKIVLTGGPGAGKTAVLEIIQRQFSKQMATLPESASLLYGGGFPRATSREERRWVQKAIYHTQDCAEHLGLLRAGRAAALICDRGTLDGLAYWPGMPQGFFQAVGSSLAHELHRYDVVIHMETAATSSGYDLSNPLRIESVTEAKQLDLKIQKVWLKHPKRYFVGSRASFLEKIDEVFGILKSEIGE
jgi:predicted ATPase